MENAGQEADNAFVRGLMPTTGRHTTKARKTAIAVPRRLSLNAVPTPFFRLTETVKLSLLVRLG